MVRIDHPRQLLYSSLAAIYVQYLLNPCRLLSLAVPNTLLPIPFPSPTTILCPQATQFPAFPHPTSHEYSRKLVTSTRGSRDTIYTPIPFQQRFKIAIPLMPFWTCYESKHRHSLNVARAMRNYSNT